MRLIDADALIEDIKTKLWNWDTVDGITATTVLKQTITDIGNAPTVDAVPVRHGQWIEDEIQIHVEKTYHCSECDCLAWGENEKTRYCPTCGAKMDDDDKWEE